ncbi:MAG: Ni/Fe-hydrogenase, b-type cytochrome subunit [Planctomycetes bacterium]|nr:Ni/Fe-hydrogenase, b-type cytochrome subunit [Planctomycetota bacterium]MCB9885930.1 Ni/Fe-hydrogenase, b-type cytochrome subunit [Planctomycetota bacterium]
MSQITAPYAAAPAEPIFKQELVWQWPIRLFHWLNALAFVVLFLTGLYISDPIFSPAGEAYGNQTMGYVRMTHFIAAAVFTVGFFWRICWFWLGNRYARSGFPYVWRARWWRNLVRQTWDYLRLDFGHVHMGHNALAGLAYTLVPVIGGWVMILTGLALFGQSNPDGFWDSLCGWVIPMLGGGLRTHMWHHLVAWLFLVFAIVHVYIVVLDGTQQRNGLISSMISGRKFYPADEKPGSHDED